MAENQSYLDELRDPAVLSADDIRRLLANGVPLDVIQRMAQQRGMPDLGWSSTGYARQWQYPYAGQDSEGVSQRYGLQGDASMLDIMRQNTLKQLQNYPRSEGGQSTYPSPVVPQNPNNYLAALTQLLMGVVR